MIIILETKKVYKNITSHENNIVIKSKFVAILIRMD